MGGEGSMQAMNTILRNNKRMLRKKGMFEEKSGTSNSNTTKLHFKKISDEELENVKKGIRKKVAKQNMNSRIIALFVILIVIVLFYFILKDFNINFDLFFRQV